MSQSNAKKKKTTTSRQGLLSSSFNLSPTLSTRCLVEEKTPVAAAIFSSSHEQSRFERTTTMHFFQLLLFYPFVKLPILTECFLDK
jgi:hypothetical protein